MGTIPGHGTEGIEQVLARRTDHVMWAAPGPDSRTGRGLALVRRITDRCGHRRDRWALTWFELDFEWRRPRG